MYWQILHNNSADAASGRQACGVWASAQGEGPRNKICGSLSEAAYTTVSARPTRTLGATFTLNAADPNEILPM